MTVKTCFPSAAFRGKCFISENLLERTKMEETFLDQIRQLVTSVWYRKYLHNFDSHEDVLVNYRILILT